MKLTIVVATSLMLASSGALADDAKAAAKMHVASARTLHAEQRYIEALAELEAAYTLDPQPGLLFALGQLHVQLDRCERALSFYRRFLASKPKAEQAAVAREAIEACKNPRPAAEKPTTPRPIAPPVTVPEVPTPPAARPQELSLPVRTTTQSHRRARRAGIGLAVAGVGAAVGSFVLYRGAGGLRDRADAATTYEEYEDGIARSDRRYTSSVIAGAIGVAAITAGAIVLTVRRRDTVQVTPTGRGATVRWSMPF
ncbi:MAG: hypothetical protein H0V17_18715 [Deltaproteobacteria bacterium]|nr:hypothetical protein [Deltaproteobacteria bacterium]